MQWLLLNHSRPQFAYCNANNFNSNLFFHLPRETFHTICRGAVTITQSKIHRPLKIGDVFFQVFRILMNQGANFPAMRNTVYVILGCYCIGASVLVCAYNILLTSFILESNTEPTVESLADLAGNSNMQLAVDEGSVIDIVLMASMGFTRNWVISCGCSRILDARKGKIALISLNPAPTHTYRVYLLLLTPSTKV